MNIVGHWIISMRFEKAFLHKVFIIFNINSSYNWKLRIKPTQLQHGTILFIKVSQIFLKTQSSKHDLVLNFQRSMLRQWKFVPKYVRRLYLCNFINSPNTIIHKRNNKSDKIAEKVFSFKTWRLYKKGNCWVLAGENISMKIAEFLLLFCPPGNLEHIMYAY